MKLLLDCLNKLQYKPFQNMSCQICGFPTSKHFICECLTEEVEPVDDKTKESIYIFPRQLTKTESKEILDSVMPQVCVENVMNCYRRFSKNKQKETLGHSVFFVLHILTFGIEYAAKRYSDRTEFFISSKKLYNCSFASIKC